MRERELNGAAGGKKSVRVQKSRDETKKSASRANIFSISLANSWLNPPHLFIIIRFPGDASR
jgi:hypothetical protein